MPSIIQDINDYARENKLQFGLMSFFMLTMVQTNLMQSGAFEIYINGNLEFSKLNNN